MRIVHAVYSLKMGGAEVIIAQLARLHRAQGHDVRVVTYAELGVIGEEMVRDGFEVRVLGETNPLFAMARYFRAFAELEPDVVHCHNVASTIQAALPARLAGVPSVVTTRHRVELNPYNRGFEAKYNLASRFCHAITGICQVTCDAVAIGPFAARNKIVLVYNGTSEVPRTDFSHLGKRGFTLLFVGRLVKEKDLGTLIDAVAIARATVIDLDCWIVGRGLDRDALEARARNLGVADSVRFWGLRTDTAPFFSAADAFVMSSISEGLPMSLLQSMSLGTPSILTDVDGMGEVLRLTQSGLLTPVRDPNAFADAIIRLATDSALHAELSARSRSEYEKRFTLDCMSEHYLKLYRDPDFRPAATSPSSA
jgi:glycosyltransferase involved in cell wall biosynthesis